MKKGVLSRNVTKQECSWLDNDLEKGKTVYAFKGYTYGCISPTGVAVSDEPDKIPFYEIPKDAITWE